MFGNKISSYISKSLQSDLVNKSLVKSLLEYIERKKQEKRQTFQQSRLLIIFLNGHLSEASLIDSKYIKMTGLQDFY